jgi:hypothetical protein
VSAGIGHGAGSAPVPRVARRGYLASASSSPCMISTAEPPAHGRPVRRPQPIRDAAPTNCTFRPRNRKGRWARRRRGSLFPSGETGGHSLRSRQDQQGAPRYGGQGCGTHPQGSALTAAPAGAANSLRNTRVSDRHPDGRRRVRLRRQPRARSTRTRRKNSSRKKVPAINVRQPF